MPSELVPYLVALPIAALIFGSYGAVMRKGLAGYVGGAIGGVVWFGLAGLIAGWLARAAPAASADISLFGCVIVAGLLAGSGLYLPVAKSILREPSATRAVLSAMMKPTVPFYITFNSALEVLFLPLVLFLNWTAEPARRWLVVAAAALFAVHRVWTYAVYAEGRLATGTQPLSEEDVAWYRRSLATDYRIYLNAVIFALFAAAAFLQPIAG